MYLPRTAKVLTSGVVVYRVRKVTNTETMYSYQGYIFSFQKFIPAPPPSPPHQGTLSNAFFNFAKPGANMGSVLQF